MRRFVAWLLAGMFSVALTILVFFPATWVATMVETQSAGRLTLGDARGTLWHGSAFIGGAASGSEALTPLLPGRFEWHLSPMIFLGRVEATLKNAEVQSQPIVMTGNWRELQVSPVAILLQAEQLVALGAPLNTIQPSGQMRLSWETMQLATSDGKIEVAGTMNLEISDISSRLSPVKPLGSYDLALDWSGLKATVTLKSIKGPMLLSGSGMFNQGRLQFSGIAYAETGQEQVLENFLSLLGQRRKEGDKDVIALEFR